MLIYVQLKGASFSTPLPRDEAFSSCTAFPQLGVFQQCVKDVLLMPGSRDGVPVKSYHNWCHPNELISINCEVSKDSDYLKASSQQYL